jgi:type III restriction enzyme
MARSVIAYDKDLPEIPGRLPWRRPDAHLIKDEEAQTRWRVQAGRRDSHLLLVPKIRLAVDDWRDQGYPDASEVTRRLFEYWFDEDHEVPGFNTPFRYYFCQREAMETLAWLIEVAAKRDAAELIQSYAEVYKKDLFSDNIVFQTSMDGRRQIVRYVPELNRDGVQDLPPKDLRRFAFKMATGSGKTWVMAMTIVWSHFHRKMVPDSDLSSNFLIVAPNVIVYQRLEKDFGSNRVFYQIPLIPPEWRGMFSQNVKMGDGHK